MSPDYVPLDQGRLGDLANYLARPVKVELFYTQADPAWEGSAGSIADQERMYRGPSPDKYSWQPRLIMFTHSLIRFRVTVMAEQALAIARLITDPDIGAYGGFAVEACVRSAIENGGRAWWLADVGIDPQERMARYKLELLHSANAAETLASTMRWHEPVDRLGISVTSDDVRRSCTELGLEVKENRKVTSISGVRRPSVTDMVTDLVDSTVFRDSKAMVYRLLSASTHGTVYGIMRAFRPTNETLSGEPAVERFTDHRVIDSSASLTLEAFAVLMERIVEFMGWDRYKSESFRKMVGNLVTSGPR